MDSIEAVARENESLYLTLDDDVPFVKSFGFQVVERSWNRHRNVNVNVVRQISYRDDDVDSEEGFERAQNDGEVAPATLEPAPPPPRLTWDVFDRHIQCIDDSEYAKDRYGKKRSTDKASETFQAAMQDICATVENLETSSSDDDESDLCRAGGTTSKDETADRYRSGTNSKRNSVDMSAPKLVTGTQPILPKLLVGRGWEAEMSTWNGSTEKARPQQLPVDENTKRRMVLYERYLNRQNSWAEGLTKSGKDILSEIQKNKSTNPRIVRMASFVRSRSKAAQIVRPSRYHSSTN